ncbi:MAG TPA: phosphatase PAP2 family protein [Solirubrobacteraceae bacterium]|nr:phosphatase PAP2 family protein [Solirubrobacteraceae bacterium]
MSTAVSIEQSAASTSTVPAPEAAVVAGTHSHARTRWWVEVLAIVWLCWIYDAITNLAPLRLHLALAHAQAVLSLESTLHIDPEHSLDRWLAGHHTLGLLVSDYYDNAHFIVTLSLLGWLWWRRADLYRPLRNTLVLVNLLAFIVFWRYPVAPPRMLSGFTDVVASTHAIGSWHTGALASHANELAAMPSLHIAWAVWCTVAVWQLTTRRWLRALAVVYPFVTALAVLATGNHFVLDMAGGLLVLAAAVLIVEGAGRLWARRREPPSAEYRRALPKFARRPYRMSQTCYEVQDRVD